MGVPPAEDMGLNPLVCPVGDKPMNERIDEHNAHPVRDYSGAKPVDLDRQRELMSEQDKVSLEGRTIKEIVADYGSEVMALVQKGKLERLPELTEGATKEILARLEKQFIWGQVPYHDLESGLTKEWTMRCISDEDWQGLSKRR